MKVYRIADTEEAVPLGLADMPIEISRYGDRSWAVYYGGQLLCVTVYLRGARAVQSLIQQMQAELRQAGAQASAILAERSTEIPGGQDGQAYA